MAEAKEFVADNWEKLAGLLYHNDWKPELKRHRSGFVYRGLGRSGYPLSTSLNRDGDAHLEQHLLRNFRKYSHLEAIGNSETVRSEWMWLALAQHHGLPTRLLDWTYSPLVALHFATANHEAFDGDAAICAVNYSQTIKYLPERAKEVIERERFEILPVEYLEQIAPSVNEYYQLREDPFVTFFEPPSLDGRIVNQYAVFSFLSDPLVTLDAWLVDKDVEWFRIIIPHAMLWQVRDRLDQANINERTLFPGLDGTAKWLRRHYKDVSKKTGL